jgi:hypothetical protein
LAETIGPAAAAVRSLVGTSWVVQRKSGKMIDVGPLGLGLATAPNLVPAVRIGGIGAVS